ncbi:MAG: phytochelatin synthase family protein [Myxococcales bacterium]|nr:phytochelatin synthase family protein [Myxococcales bacterium]
MALDVPEGRALLASAATADLDGLRASFQSQEKSSWCGVASSVVVLDARADHLTQDTFFTPEATAVRSWWRVTLTGMPLDDLAGMLRAHGADVEVHHADDVDEAAFRAALRTNLATPGDWLVANYDRSALGESGGGHLSPLGAFAESEDMVLILDVSAYKYPPHWVPVTALFGAMSTVDSESGRARGWVSVR